MGNISSRNTNQKENINYPKNEINQNNENNIEIEHNKNNSSIIEILRDGEFWLDA